MGALLYMAVFGAVISYFMQCLSFILLRRKMPNIERPYRSPVGEWGAGIAGAIALVSLISLYFNDDYRPGVYGTLIYFVLGIAYFAIAGRNRLVLSPEEEFAMTRGEHGRPQREGYGTTHVADIQAGEPTTTRDDPRPRRPDPRPGLSRRTPPPARPGGGVRVGHESMAPRRQHHRPPPGDLTTTGASPAISSTRSRPTRSMRSSTSQPGS